MIAALAGIVGGLVGLVEPVLVAMTAVAVIAGAVAAVSARDGRLAIIGLAVALTASPFLTDPLPDVRGLAARVVGALVATYVLILAEQTGPTRTTGSRIGWPAEALAAGTASVIGLGAASGLAGTLAQVGLNAAGGPSVAAFAPFGPGLAVGLAVLLLAVGPLLFAGDAVGLGVAILLGAVGVTLVRSGLAGSPSQLEELATSSMFVAIGVGAALIARAATPTWGELREPSGFDIDDAADEDEMREARAVREDVGPSPEPTFRVPIRVRGPRSRDKAIEAAQPATVEEAPSVEAAPSVDQPPVDEIQPGAGEQPEAEASRTNAETAKSADGSVAIEPTHEPDQGAATDIAEGAPAAPDIEPTLADDSDRTDRVDQPETGASVGGPPAGAENGAPAEGDDRGPTR